MATTPRRSRSPRVRTTIKLLFALATTLVACTIPSSTHAAATVAANYASGPVRDAAGAAVHGCRGWGGDTDDAGRFYTICLFARNGVTTPALVEYDTGGTVRQLGWLPSEYAFTANAPGNYVTLDVGVSPDGGTAYVTPGPNIDNLGQHPERHPFTGQPLPNGARSGAILRLKRQASGAWSYDPSWKAGPFLLGANYWAARRLEVDARGRVYVSVNAYVFELSPTTATRVSYFGGGTTDGPGGAWIDGIDKAQGLAVSADGASILVVDQQHQIVQRWRRVGATDWTRDRSFLLGVPDAVGDYCGTTTHFQSPYDVAQDAAGDVYVMDTTCNRVQRFTSTGRFVQTVWRDRDADTLELSHGFAVNWQGSILLPAPMSILRRTDPPVRAGGPKPPTQCTDKLAPTITGVAYPAPTRARHVLITVKATDDCSGARQVHVSGHRTGSPRWVTGASTKVPLSGWNGPKRLVVSVRDGSGRITSRTVQLQLSMPQPRLRSRSFVRMPGARCSKNPMARVGGAASYRIVDRCARIVGRVTSIRRTRGGQMIQVMVPVTTARRIYRNAVGAVRIWVVTDRRTRVTRRVRPRRGVVLLGTLVAERDLDATFAIPVDSIAGR